MISLCTKINAAIVGWQGAACERIAATDILSNLDGVVQYIVAEASAPSGALCAPPPPEGEEL
jgi:hypothetical protein